MDTTMEKFEKLIIYMPALNEAKNIQQVIASLPKHLEGVNEIKILVIDDGSTDQTAEQAREMDAHVISHHKNLGLGKAFQSAVNYALENGASILVSIDADGQFNPENIVDLIAPIQKQKAQMVTGNRFSNGKPKNMPRTKYWGNQQVSKILNAISKTYLQDVSCGFRAYSREALYQLNLFGRYSYTHETILNLAFKGLPILEYPIKVKYFSDRESRIASSLLKYAFNTGKIIFRTMLDYKPLLFFGNLGVLNLFIASIFIGFMLIHYFITGAFTPYKSYGFIGLGFAIFGLIILFIGLVADMLNRIRMNQDKILYELKKNKSK
jgi:glycosyltransferase involved in cell wall biosynthesis